MSLPEGWPENVKYHNSILYQKGVDCVAEFKLPELQLSNLEVFCVPRRHPAYPGRGVRVLREIIKKGEDVAYYAGFYRPAMVAPNNGYLFDTYNKEKDMVVDALLCGNASRFFNDIRGMNCEANLVAVDASFALGAVTLWTIVFSATRDIQVGEELLINYQADGQERYWEPPEVIDLTIEPVHIKREPNLEEPEPEPEPEVVLVSHKCRICAVVLDNTNLGASRLRSGNWICTTCYTRERFNNPADYLANKFGKYLKRLRKQGGPQVAIQSTAHFMRQILRKQPLPEEAHGDVHKCSVILDDKQQPKIILTKDAYSATRAMRMKREREAKEDDDDDEDDDDEIECPKCGTLHAQKHGSRKCLRCENKQRLSDAGAHLSKKFCDSLRVKGRPPPYPGVDFVRELIAASLVPEGDDIHAYTIVVIDDAKPLTLENVKLEKGRRPHRRKNRRKTTNNL